MTADVINCVPRELLRDAMRMLEAHSPGSGSVESYAAQDIQALLATAQPADHSEHDLNMVSQPAADGEREAFEAYCQTIGYTLKTGDSGHYLGGYGAEIWAGWKARAAQPQQAVAVTDEVRRLREALSDAAQSLETISNGAGLDKFMKDASDVRGYARSRAGVARAALSAHKTGEEE